MESQGELIGKIKAAAEGIGDARKEMQQLKDPTSDQVDRILERVAYHMNLQHCRISIM